MLKVDDLTFQRDRIILDKVTFSCSPKTITVLTGRNGSGKTTLLNILTGYLTSSGIITWNEKSLDYKKVDLISDQIVAYQELTVLENIQFFCDIHKFKNPLLLIQKFGLEKYLNFFVAELSKGFKQRLNILLALLSEPEILLLDEPNANLDREQNLEFIEILKDLKNQCTIIITSHHSSELFGIAEQIINLENGRIC